MDIHVCQTGRAQVSSYLAKVEGVVPIQSEIWIQITMPEIIGKDAYIKIKTSRMAGRAFYVMSSLGSSLSYIFK